MSPKNLVMLCASVSFVSSAWAADDSNHFIVKRVPSRELLASEARAVAATIDEALKHVRLQSYVVVESRVGYFRVFWGPNDANVRDGGASFYVDAKTFKITCTEIDGHSIQRCTWNEKTSRMDCVGGCR